jgi:hypothetical protein
VTDQPQRATSLLAGAYAAGELSEGSKNALLRVADVGVEIDAMLGQDPTQGSNCLLVTLLVDDSASIAEIPSGPEAVRLGHNTCLEALDGTSAQLLVSTRRLHRGVITPYRDLRTAAQLSSENYSAVAPVTPLYREALITLGSVMAKARDLTEQGNRVRTFTLLITDSQDNASAPVTASDVKFLVTDMLEFSDKHIIAAMGIGSPEEFERVFGAMGIPSPWILSTDATAVDIQNLFRYIAAQLRLAAASEQGFRELLAGPQVRS